MPANPAGNDTGGRGRHKRVLGVGLCPGVSIGWTQPALRGPGSRSGGVNLVERATVATVLSDVVALAPDHGPLSLDHGAPQGGDHIVRRGVRHFDQ